MSLIIILGVDGASSIRAGVLVFKPFPDVKYNERLPSNLQACCVFFVFFSVFHIDLLTTVYYSVLCMLCVVSVFSGPEKDRFMLDGETFDY